MNKDNGGPAFPVPLNPGSSYQGHGGEVDGMTLRDYFAAKVCAAMVSTIKSDDDYHRAVLVAKNLGHDGLSEWFAYDSYKQADAMLAERAK